MIWRKCLLHFLLHMKWVRKQFSMLWKYGQVSSWQLPRVEPRAPGLSYQCSYWAITMTMGPLSPHNPLDRWHWMPQPHSLKVFQKRTCLVNGGCYLWKANARSRGSCTGLNVACILHIAVLNTDPDSCPPEVKPHPIKTTYTTINNELKFYMHGGREWEKGLCIC